MSRRTAAPPTGQGCPPPAGPPASLRGDRQPEARALSEGAPRTDHVVTLLTEATGLAFPDWRRPAVDATIARLMASVGARDDADLARRLGADRGLLATLVGDITVGETWFFREPERLGAIADVLLPEIVARRRPAHRARIWSAGCATGEEPYTLAILAWERGLAEQTLIVGTDLSRAALARAREGRYRPWALRGLDAMRRAAWFRPAGQQLALAPAIREMVCFAQHNLARDPPPAALSAVGGADLILCRNVMIYMGPEVIRRVAKLLWSALAPGGWLLLGASDPPLGELVPLEVLSTATGLVYRRPAGERRAQRSLDGASTGATPGHVAGGAAPGAPDGDGLRGLRAVQGPATEPVAAATSAARSPTLHEPPVPRSVEAALAEPGRQARPVHGPAAGAEAALAAVDRAIRHYPLSAELRLVRGLALLEGGRPAEAERSLRDALFLDRDLAPAHFTLGSVLLGAGDVDGAARAFRNAATIAETMPPDAPVPFGGEPWGKLAEAARAQHALVVGRAGGAS